MSFEHEDERPSPELLRAAWREVVPPEPPDALEDADPTTRRCVTYLREAWRRVPLPSADPVEFRTRLRFRRRRAFGRRLIAVAAVVLIVGLPFVLTQGADELEQQAVAQPAPLARLVDVRPDHVELVSGPVRLVLLTPGGDTPRVPATRSPSTDEGKPR